MSENLIEVKNLKKYFKLPEGQLHAVDDVSFGIVRGETLGLVGESGCGKSTIGRVILRLIPHTDGQVLYKGENILEYPEEKMRALRNDMQMIFQDPYASLNPRMTILDSVKAPLDVYEIGTEQERVQMAKDLLEYVGLGASHIYKMPQDLSGGQRQRNVQCFCGQSRCSGSKEAGRGLQ